MSDFTQIWSYIINHKEILVAVFGAGGVSIATQLLKKAAKLENERVIQLLFAGISFAAAGLQYLLGLHNVPPTVLGLHTAVLMGLGSQWYTHIIKPLDNAVLAVKKTDLNQMADQLGGSNTAVISPSTTANTGALGSTTVTVSEPKANF